MNYRIGKETAFLMLSFAITIDLLKKFLVFILIGFFVNWIITLSSYLIFYIWYKTKGITFIGKKGVAFFSSFFIEIIPILDIIPATTLQVLFNISISRIEDRLNIKITK